MFKKLFFLPFILFLFLLFITSCVPDEFTREYNTDILWTPTINGPVAFGTLNLGDMLDEMLDSAGLDLPVEIEDDSTNLYYVTYSDHVSSIRADEWIKIPDQYFPEVYFYRSPVDIPALDLGITGDTIKKTKIEDFEFVFKHNERIDSIFLAEGNLHIYTSSTLRHTGYLVIHSEEIKIEDEFYCDTVFISDPSGSFQDHAIRSLNNSALRLDNQSNPDTTFLEIKFDFYLVHSGNDIKAGEEINVDMVFTDLDFQSAFGYFGDYDTVLIENEQLEFEIFEGEFSGNVYFGDPRFNLDIVNSFGLAIGIDLFGLYGYSEKTGQSTDIVFEPGVNPFVINAPTMTNVGESVITELSINNQNSNIDTVTNTTLSYISYNVRALTNPGGSGVQENFILDSSAVSVDFEMVLPMDLRAEDFSLEDTVEFDLYDLLKADSSYTSDDSTTLLVTEVKSLEIRMETENGMPVEINMQVFLVDSNYNVIDSLFTEETKNVLPSGITDENGKVIYPSQNEIFIDFSSDRIDQLRDIRHALVNGTFETTDEGQKMVKFYSYYEISFKLGVKAEASLNTIKQNK
jgi:hypothetical protein